MWSIYIYIYIYTYGEKKKKKRKRECAGLERGREEDGGDRESEWGAKKSETDKEGLMVGWMNRLCNSILHNDR